MCGLAEFFPFLVSPDDWPEHKPAPGPVAHGCDLLGLSARVCLYVGDSPFDLQAGRGAGCPTAAVLWGMFPEEVLLAADVSVGECFALSRKITEGYLKGDYDAVKLCYTRFDSMMTQTAVTMEVLPLTIEPTEEQKAAARRSQILYKPSSEEVFRAIIPEYVAGIVYGAVCESVASELAARRTAMDAATKNAGEMIDHLNLYYNRARQAAITQEITEIVAGAEI